MQPGIPAIRTYLSISCPFGPEGGFATTKWRMRGSILGACNCDWGCPCNYDARPTEGHCDGVYVLAIKKGNYGATKLDGLHAIYAGSFPGAVHEGNGTGVVIIDERADADQRKALDTLRKGGGVGPPFDIFAKVTARWLDPIFAPFEVKLDGIRSRVRVGGGRIYELAITRIKNPVTGAEEELYLDKPTGFTSKRSELGMSTVARLAADDLSFDNGGHYAEFANFDYSGG